MRRLTAGLITAALLLTAPAQAAPRVNSQSTRTADPTDATALEKRLDALIDKVVKGGAKACPKARPDLIAYVHSPAFPKVSEQTRRSALMMVIGCTGGQQDGEGLYAAKLLEPIALGGADRGLANFQLMLDEEERAPLSAARRLNVILEEFPDLVVDWDAGWLGPMMRAAREDESLELSLLSKLVAIDWTNRDTRETARAIWRMDLARRQARLGNLIALRATLAPIDEPRNLISIAQDRRFEPLWPEMEAAGRFDWKAVAEADLARKRKAAADAPRSLAAVTDLMEALRLLSRADEAIAVGKAAKASLERADAFEDQEDKTPWLLMTLAQAYEDVGEDAQMDAVFAEAIVASDKSGDHISQRVNWSGSLRGQGKTEQALKLLNEIKDNHGSPYGLAWRDSGMICVFSETDRPRAEAMLARMRPKWDDNPAALTQSLLCLDKVDEAAALIVKRLESPVHRDGALGLSLKGLPYPRPLTPYQTRLKANRDKLMAKPEVGKALARYVRPVTVPYGGDYWSVE